MVFIGRDWRAPGETWVRTPMTNGWERSKLRPIQISSDAIPIPCSPGDDQICHTASASSLMSMDSRSSRESRDSLSEESGLSEIDETWIPHCHIKSKSKEFVGCTSMSDAFHNLDLARGVYDLKRFNYICKVVQILVQDKLQNLSATARKTLLQILTAIVLRSVEGDVHLSTARDLVSRFGSALEGHICMHHVCGSPQLISRHQHQAGNLLEFISEEQPSTPADADETATTFLDLPREVMSLVLRKLPDHTSILEAAKAHETLQCLVDGEGRLWQSLCSFHFSPMQIKSKYQNSLSWRENYFLMKRHFGVKEFYADMIHLCCHCKCLFWRSLGHPCVSEAAPSVRVTPQQFVDMLLFL